MAGVVLEWWKQVTQMRREGQRVCFLLKIVIMLIDKRLNILSWNLRGAASRAGRRNVKVLVRKYCPDVVILLETHIPFAKAEQFWRSLGYHMVGVSEEQGQSGGVWVLEANNRHCCSLEDCFRQMVTVRVKEGSTEWLCSGVYASPTPSVCESLWEYMVQLRSTIQIPWMLVGDFNEVLLPTEVHGGSFSFHRASLFVDVLEDCGLMDLGNVGLKFTWVRHA